MYSTSRPHSSVGLSSSTNNKTRKNNHYRTSSAQSNFSSSPSPSPPRHPRDSISPTHSDFTLTQPYYPYVYYYYNSPFHGVASFKNGGNHRTSTPENVQQNRYSSPGKKMLNGTRPVTFSQFMAKGVEHQEHVIKLNERLDHFYKFSKTL